jgi:hypothetical protein
MDIQAKGINPSRVNAESGKRSRTGVIIEVVRLPKLIALALAVTIALLFIASPAGSRIIALLDFDKQIDDNVDQMLSQGKHTFRADTFGDEAFWGDLLKLHQAIEGVQFGGVGPGLSPSAALGLGLKVDVDALPKGLVKQLKQGKVDLNDPAVTLVLLRHNAVLGVEGFFNEDNGLRSVGITCALCHSTVDNSLTAGIGHRLDGWANRDLNVGEIVALAPDLSPFSSLLGVDQDTVRTVLRSWVRESLMPNLFSMAKHLIPNRSPTAW